MHDTRFATTLATCGDHYPTTIVLSKSVQIQLFQLHNMFSESSEVAYMLVYLRKTDSNGHVHTSLVSSKLLAELLLHINEVPN